MPHRRGGPPSRQRAQPGMFFSIASQGSAQKVTSSQASSLSTVAPSLPLPCFSFLSITYCDLKSREIYFCVLTVCLSCWNTSSVWAVPSSVLLSADPHHFESDAVVVCSGCCNEVPQTGWLKQQKFNFSCFWRLEV